MSGSMRYDAKRDFVEQDIVDALEQAFCSVVPLTGKSGLPDLLVGRASRNYLLEVKSGDGKLSASQEKFCREWRGDKPLVVRSVDEALKAVGIG